MCIIDIAYLSLEFMCFSNDGIHSVLVLCFALAWVQLQRETITKAIGAKSSPSTENKFANKRFTGALYKNNHNLVCVNWEISSWDHYIFF